MMKTITAQTDPMSRRIDRDALMLLARRSAAVDTACSCASPPPLAWTSMPLALPESSMDQVGTLVVGEMHELAMTEYHPSGTHYWSEDAPIAIDHYPCNASTVWTCRQCSRCFLHYTEAGGYFSDRRIRLLRPELIAPENPEA